MACQSVSFILAHPIEERLKFAKHLQGEMFLLKGKNARKGGRQNGRNGKRKEQHKERRVSEKMRGGRMMDEKKTP